MKNFHKDTMRRQIDHVAKFHEVFQIGNAEKPTAAVAQEIYELRHRLMHEENEEYLQAAKKGDLVEVADALGDMMYILCGTILKHGLQEIIEDVFEEIQRSNMSKLDHNGEPIVREDGKILKSERYFRPDIAGIFREKGHEPFPEQLHPIK
jgi:predicted HAD superfamily Cof-like phosphohydrolase